MDHIDQINQTDHIDHIENVDHIDHTDHADNLDPISVGDDVCRTCSVQIYPKAQETCAKSLRSSGCRVINLVYRPCRSSYRSGIRL